ncbi:hypothetical protein BDN72DRAFT_876312 [Pluteus cervinus]|uniref:Uncharacterized protein n=1 Tax=Pluteus cervinus TaxID=181527 RepID=A0ACD3B534_9AGAR|nr:hypothetical protein BDN72DRAFT_876312 [Pluteus cervinus]
MRPPNNSSPLGESAEPLYSDIDYFTQLPPELLTEIAKYSHINGIRQVEQPVLSLTEHYLKPVLSLAAVSRKLRSIATREPCLWGHIRINTRTTDEEVIIACLERSMNHPLSILWIGEGDLRESLVEMIVKHSHRWISFDLVSAISTYLNSFMRGPFWNVKAPILKRFYVACTAEDAGEESFGENCFDFPSIQHIKLYRYPFPEIHTMKILTRLEFEAPKGGEFSFESLALVAENLTRLEYLNLQNALDFDGNPQLTGRPDRITWPSLLELAIWGEKTAEGFIWRYLQLFQAPKLRKFVAISPDSKDFKTLNTTAARIAANIPLVKEVTLICHHIDATTGRKLFVFFPKTTHLSLCDYPCEGRKPFFNTFFYPNGLSNTKIWPDLGSITLGYIQDEKLLRSIVDCLQHRKKNGFPVAKIFIPGGQALTARELRPVHVDLCVVDIPSFTDYGFKPQ